MFPEHSNGNGSEEVPPSAKGKLCCHCARILDDDGQILTRHAEEKPVELPFCFECFVKEYLTRAPRWC
jgi:hypothetical protein